MKAVAFDYHRPDNIDDAIRLLTVPGAKVMAGGQTLGPMLNLRLARPSVVVDVSRIPALVETEVNRTHVTLGACITHAAIEDGRVADPAAGILARVARGIAYRAVRTRGTIGGSVAHADPAADWLSLLIALDATVVLHGPEGRRLLPILEFVTGPLTTTLAANELLTAVRIPRLDPDARIGYAKICRKTGEFAHAIGVAICSPSGHVRMVSGANDGVPTIIDGVVSKATPRAERRSAIRAHLARTAGQADVFDLNVHTAALERAIDEATAR